MRSGPYHLTTPIILSAGGQLEAILRINLQSKSQLIVKDNLVIAIQSSLTPIVFKSPNELFWGWQVDLLAV